MTAVFTLFEKNYHFGVASLINSLVYNGFTGIVYIGYKGEIPFWTKGKLHSDSNITKVENAEVVQLNPNVHLIFIKLETSYHLTNYKPHFILDILNVESQIFGSIFYFDPDIIIIGPWQFYENWLNYGVAVVHEISWNDMPDSHPIRKNWLKISNAYNIVQTKIINSYINAGFVGLNTKHIGFIMLWKNLIEISVANFEVDPKSFSQKKHEIFYCADQDLFNLALMCCNEPISEFGPDGMSLIDGGTIMSHSVGSPKPWNYKEPTHFLKGLHKSMQLKHYWQYANGIITPYSANFIKYKQMQLKLFSFLSRFYKK